MADRTLRIDHDLCQGHAMCFLLAPDLFEVDDQGRGTVIDPSVQDDDESPVLVAIDRCPERAISLHTP